MEKDDDDKLKDAMEKLDGILKSCHRNLKTLQALNQLEEIFTAEIESIIDCYTEADDASPFGPVLPPQERQKDKATESVIMWSGELVKALRHLHALRDTARKVDKSYTDLLEEKG